MTETRVDTEVLQERGQWNVYLLVTTPEGVTRRQLTTHRNQREADLMADLLRRSARRRRSLPDPP